MERLNSGGATIEGTELTTNVLRLNGVYDIVAGVTSSGDTVRINEIKRDLAGDSEEVRIIRASVEQLNKIRGIFGQFKFNLDDLTKNIYGYNFAELDTRFIVLNGQIEQLDPMIEGLKPRTYLISNLRSLVSSLFKWCKSRQDRLDEHPLRFIENIPFIRSNKEVNDKEGIRDIISSIKKHVDVIDQFIDGQISTRESLLSK